MLVTSNRALSFFFSVMIAFTMANCTIERETDIRVSSPSEDRSACIETGLSLRSQGRLDEAKRQFRRCCDGMNDYHSCNQYGFLVQILGGDNDLAMQYYKKACDGGYEGGCRNLADVPGMNTPSAKKMASSTVTISKNSTMQWKRIMENPLGNSIPLCTRDGILASRIDMTNNKTINISRSSDQGRSWHVFKDGESGLLCPLGAKSDRVFFAHNQNSYDPMRLLKMVNLYEGKISVIGQFKCNITAFDFGNKDELFVGSEWGEVHYSPDLGQNWVKIGHLGSEELSALLHTTNGELIAGSQFHGLVSLGSDRDKWRNGQSFDDVATAVERGKTNGEKLGDFGGVYDIVEGQAGVLIVAGSRGLFRRADDKSKWEKLPARIMAGHLIYDGDKNLLVAFSPFRGIHFSADSGISWTMAATDFPATASISSMSMDREMHIYAGTREEGLYLLDASSIVGETNQ